MLKDKLLKQAKPRLWLGGFQVQLSQSMANYMIYFNLSFMGLMFWHTTAAPWLRQYYPGAVLWMFVLFMVLILTSLMLLDRKLAYPSRQAYLNRQTYKHANPAVDDLRELKKNLKKLMKELGIEYENN